jgi:hypothetical protein
MGALISLLVTIALSLLITHIASMALTMTGLSRDLAKFQARSAFTGVGFTTSEAEQVVAHPVRRRILMLLMLLGNAGIVTAISSLVLTFVGTTDPTGQLVRFGSIALGLGLIWVLSSSRWLNRVLSVLIHWALKHWTRLEVRDYSNLLHLVGDYQVSELKVDKEDWLANKPLSDLCLRDEGIAVLGIQRPNGHYLGAPNGETCIKPQDLLILYGRADNLSELDSREANLQGDAAHQNAMAKQQQVISEQHRQEEKAQTQPTKA